MDKYRCLDCGEIFDCDEAEHETENVGEFWGAPAYMDIDICPCCGSQELEDYEEADIEECKEIVPIDAKCNNCGREFYYEDGITNKGECIYCGEDDDIVDLLDAPHRMAEKYYRDYGELAFDILLKEIQKCSTDFEQNRYKLCCEATYTTSYGKFLVTEFNDKAESIEVLDGTIGN